ncbi:MAG: hypothetical protein Tsb007_15220 [Rhizobacter sp.]
MKLNKLSLAVVAACGVMSTSAFALPASSYTNTGEFAGDTMNIRVSGATAQDPGFLAAALSYCSAGTMHRYSVSNNFVYFCTAGAAVTPRPGATKVAFYKYSVGGSGSGVGFVNSATPIPFLDLDKIDTSCAGTSATADIDGTGPLSSFVDVTCAAATTAVTTNAVSYIGISDVEPSFFGAPSSYNNLTAEGLASVIFGVPVTRNVYEALQAQQGLTVGSLTEANMPSLSQAQVTTMYTQLGQTWGNLGINTGLADDTIYVARRADSSGTQKSFEAVIGKTINGTSGAKSCIGAVEPFVAGTDVLNNAAADALCAAVDAGDVVAQASGSSQVLRCMEGHQSRARGAVGVLSTEYKQTAGGSIRFVKINGVAPTHAQVAAGSYQQYTDASLNTRTGGTLLTAAAPGYPAFLTLLKTSFATPSTVAIINAGNQTFGPSGLMALDALESPVPAADYSGATGRNPWSRLVGGVELNNCQSGKAAAF